MAIFTWSLTALQLLFPVVVMVSTTSPVAISEGCGVYRPFREVAPPGLNEPNPPVQLIPDATLRPVALSCAAGLFSHTNISDPALIVGAAVNVYLTLLFTSLQLPLPVEVATSVRLPASNSAVVGV